MSKLSSVNRAKRDIKKNIVISIIAQLISLGVGLVLNLITPKFISEYSYAIWHTYLLYASYVGVLHFGLLDGIVLRYSQYDYDQLDKPLIRSQFKVLLCMTGFFLVLLCMYSITFSSGDNALLFLLVALAIVIKNIYTYTSFTFQITNRIAKYTTLVIADRLLYGAFVIVILICRRQEFYLFCLADLAACLISTIIGMRFNRGLYLGESVPCKTAITEVRCNFSAGSKLMLANWASMLLDSGARMVIQWKWDTIVFGKVAFAFGVSNLFLQFINAASIALFPSLKRFDLEELPKLYTKTREMVTAVLFLAMILYFPGSYVLKLWLPKYAVSLHYAGILIPVVIYSSKVSLLTNNFFKIYRKEKLLFWVNTVTVTIGLMLYFFYAYIIENMTAVLFAVVFVNMLRSFVSEYIITKLIEISLQRDFIIEIAMTAGFIYAAYVLGAIKGFFLYSCFILVYLLLYRNKIFIWLDGLLKKL